MLCNYVNHDYLRMMSRKTSFFEIFAIIWRLINIAGIYDNLTYYKSDGKERS